MKAQHFIFFRIKLVHEYLHFDVYLLKFMNIFLKLHAIKIYTRCDVKFPRRGQLRIQIYLFPKNLYKIHEQHFYYK